MPLPFVLVIPPTTSTISQLIYSKKHFQNGSICFSGWFGTWFIFPYIGNVIIPFDFHIFQRGGSTTNQFLFTTLFSHLGVSENVVYPFLPNGFADHYPY